MLVETGGLTEMFWRIVAAAVVAMASCAHAIAEEVEVAPNGPAPLSMRTEPASFHARFDGAYVGITGGYDFSTPGQQTAIGNLSPLLSSVDDIKGGKTGGIIGYNVTSGRLLLGFEGRAQYAFSDDSRSASYVVGLPLPLFLGSCYGCSSGSVTTSAFSLPGSVTYSDAVSHPFSGDFSFRAGIVFDQDWLIYGRAGVGAEQNKLVTKSDSTNSSTCVAPIITARPVTGGFIYNVTGCGSVVQGTLVTTTLTSVSPTVALAGGVERNFGPIFARVEGELLIHFPSFIANQAYYSPSVNVALGYRF